MSASFKGAQEHDDVDGVEVTRIGGKYSLYAKLALYYSKQLKAKYDVIVDEINTIPFFTPLYAKEPYVAFIHQFAANVLFEELPWMQAKSWSFMEPFALRLYGNAPIITSQGTKLDLLNIGIPEKNIHVIDYGVDRSIYRKGKKSLYPHVLYLGRLKRFKGVHLLIDAMKQVVKQIPDAKLSIVGNGDPIYENELRRLTTKLKLENNVAFHELGFQGSVLEKAQLMQEAWVLAYPSSREGFGLAVAEANACGTPTVATDVPGLRETVKNYETGILVPRNCDSIAKSVIHLLTNDEL